MWLGLSLILLHCLCVTPVNADAKSLETLHQRLLALNTKVDSLIRQAVLVNLAFEEGGRQDGDSGVKTVQTDSVGTKPYYDYPLAQANHFPGGIGPHHLFTDRFSVTSMQASLNGVDFKVQGTWVHLKQPSRTSKNYLAVEDIPLPAVPPEVLQKATIKEQTEEMLEWFKAFRDNNYRTRDYRKYFKPVVCYLEGWWEKISEAKFKTNSVYGFKEFMYQGISGLRKTYWPRESRPMQIWETDKNTGLPVFAEWKTRIACQPFSSPFLKPDRFILVDDVSSRMMLNAWYKDYKNYYPSRFIVNAYDNTRVFEGRHRTALLDQIMANVPGLDNHQGRLSDTAFDLPVYKDDKSNTVENTAFYHRFYRVKEAGAMGQHIRHRGYTDSSVFMAQTSQPNVAEQSAEECKYVNRQRICKTFTQKFTYAVPLMIMYMTPLLSWNPYKLTQFKTAAEMYANGRNGGNSLSKAYTGYLNEGRCTKIPYEFFQPPEYGAYTLVGGKLQRVGGCGSRMIIRPKGLGRIRLTFPIFATYHEGSAVMKETAALQDMILEEAKYKGLWKM